MNQLISVQAAADLIRGGKCLSVAGPEAALDQLPPGNWVGGTTPYFMVESGVVVQDARVFVTDLTPLGAISFASYGSTELANISNNGPENGFALAIIPAGSTAHQRFAAEAATYESAFLKPTVGWIAGVHVADIGKVAPKVYDGRTGGKYEDRAVVAYVSLPDEKLAVLEIVNLFEADDGDLLEFEATSFEVGDCLVNGVKTRFADYLRQRGLEGGTLPLVGDFAGAAINVSLQSVGEVGGIVKLYAPVFPGVAYRFAKPVPDYAQRFRDRLANEDNEGLVWSCNCILNFLFGELEGKAIGGVQGPVTFGEIAYQLLNQTLVAVRIQ
jgi:hypothetical protein